MSPAPVPQPNPEPEPDPTEEAVFLWNIAARVRTLEARQTDTNEQLINIREEAATKFITNNLWADIKRIEDRLGAIEKEWM